jgi:hypothetical protein
MVDISRLQRASEVTSKFEDEATKSLDRIAEMCGHLIWTDYESVVLYVDQLIQHIQETDMNHPVH